MRRETVTMLRENFDNFQCLLEDIRCGVSLISPAMEILDLNGQMKKWFPQLDETKKTPCYRLIADPPRDGICPGCPVVKTLADGKRHEAVKNTSDGAGRRSFRRVSLPVKDRFGKILAALELLADTTEQLRAEEKIRGAHHEFKQIFDAAGNGMRVIDTDYKLLRVNKAFSMLAGAAAEELVGRKCFEAFPCPRCVSPECRVARALGGEERFVMEVERERPDGGRCWCLVESAALRDPEGTMMGIVQNFTDISARKQAEGALQESERNLQKQKAELEKANIVLKALLNQIDQEKRHVEEQVSANIMGLIEPYVNKLKKSGLSQRQQGYVDIMETNLIDVVSPVVRTSVAMHLRFTPTEIQITRLVKQGRTSKEIAELLHLSPRTVEKHRRNIRKKTGITNKKINLQTILSAYL